MRRLSFSSKLDLAPYIVPIAKTASTITGALIRFMTFPSPEVALCLCKSTIHPCMEYCCHSWASATNCYSDMLDKLLKRMSKNVGPLFIVSLEPLAHLGNVASLSLFYRFYFGIRSSEVYWFHFLILVECPLDILIVCIIFL